MCLATQGGNEAGRGGDTASVHAPTPESRSPPRPRSAQQGEIRPRPRRIPDPQRGPAGAAASTLEDTGGGGGGGGMDGEGPRTPARARGRAARVRGRTARTRGGRAGGEGAGTAGGRRRKDGLKPARVARTWPPHALDWIGPAS
ncbi:hypothetical protein GQ55_7G273900 [Panicum hallii var. hallii]|uniref:Uncharacterized protein n=1 Tax=Panicum hallii var. hallii TaxID=1504633 RepID=A0A2T7CZK0_9POAL|nr:hypothetical protein GQ55_7G273900 [Panicum hallii var. hallii]